MKEKISTLQLGAISWQLILSSCIGITPYVLFYKLKQDSWIAVILSFILGFLILGLYLYIWGKMPEKNFFEKTEALFGKALGKLINFIIIFANTYMAIVYFYSITGLIRSQYLIKTPTFFILIILIIPTIFLITQKLEVIGRASFVFWIIGITLFILTLFGLTSQLDISKIFPILENNNYNIFNGTLLTIPYTLFIMLGLMSIPKDNIIDKQKLNKRMVAFYIIAFICILLGFLFIIMCLGGDLAKMYQYAEFQVIKMVSLVGFIERVENFLSIRWIFYMFTTAIINLYFIKVFCKHTFKIKKSGNILISIITIICFILSKWLFPNNTIGNKMILNIIPWVLYPIYLGIPLIMAIIIKAKKF